MATIFINLLLIATQHATIEPDLVTVAQILHQDMVEQHGPGQKVAISDVIDRAKQALDILEYKECLPQHVLVAMESRGLVTRRKKEYIINSDQA